MKRLIVHPDKCTSCRQCELSCSFKKTGRFSLADARLRVLIRQEDAYSVPVVCQHCDDAECMDVCPAGAIHRDPMSGAVVISEELCLGCGACADACPENAIRIDADGNVAKCDLCNGDPECVKACIAGALEYGESDLSAG